MIPFSESTGEPASLQRIECAWCGKPLGAQVCAPEMANTVSHGMCPACSAKQRASLEKTLVHGECLEGATDCVTCGLNRADAGSPALPSPGNKSLGSIEAASSQVLAPLAEKGTPAPADAQASVGTSVPHAAMGHLSRGPAASFSFSARPLFWTVTGYDFARSIAWAKSHGNPVADQIRDHKGRLS